MNKKFRTFAAEWLIPFLGGIGVVGGLMLLVIIIGKITGAM